MKNSDGTSSQKRICTRNIYTHNSFNIFHQNFVLIFSNSGATENVSENFLMIKDQTL